MANDGNGTNWDETAPASTDLIAKGDDEIRDLRKGVALRMENEHTDAQSTVAGSFEHIAGSAKAYIQSAAPTQRPDAATSLTSSDDGRFWFDPDVASRMLYIYDDSSTETNKWTPLGLVPVGSIIAWHKSYENTPSLPANFLECNGQTVDDEESPYDGQVIPDLNDDTNRTIDGTAETFGGAFLRGGDTSGTFSDDTLQYHDHEYFSRTGGADTGGVHYFAKSNSTAGYSTDGTKGIIDSLEGSKGALGGDVRESEETKPFNMTVVWIMRIK